MHTIRLRHPWKSELQEGVVLWTRSFNWPADNASQETIYLAIRPWHEHAQVVLNDEPLKTGDTSSRCNVTSLLREFNRVQITLPAENSSESRFPLEVQLEIEEGV